MTTSPAQTDDVDAQVHAFQAHLLLSIQLLKTCMPNLRPLQSSRQRAAGEFVCKLSDILIDAKTFPFMLLISVGMFLVRGRLSAFALQALICGSLVPQLIVWNYKFVLDQPELSVVACFFWLPLSLSSKHSSSCRRIDWISSTKKTKQVGKKFLGIDLTLLEISQQSINRGMNWIISNVIYSVENLAGTVATYCRQQQQHCCLCMAKPSASARNGQWVS